MVNPANLKQYALSAPTLTWLADKWTDFDTVAFRPFGTKAFVEKFLHREGGVLKISGEVTRNLGYFRTIDSYRYPDGLGCWGGLDSRPPAMDVPQCAECSYAPGKKASGCQPDQGTLWVRPSSEKYRDIYRFSAHYVEALLKANKNKRIPLLLLARILYPDHTGTDQEVATQMIEEFHLTDEELQRLFSEIPDGATTGQNLSSGGLMPSAADIVDESQEANVIAEVSSAMAPGVPEITLHDHPWDLPSVLRDALTMRKLQFTPWQVATFYTALQTKGFVILSGISGTGKTRLAQAFAGMLPQPAEGANHLFVTVRPDWRDSKSLLGYYNPLTGTYEWTPFLRFLLRAEQNHKSKDKLAWFVILDEMNLAHVEYYFADLLSVLESGRDEDGWTREPLRLGYPDEAKGNLPPPELKLPPNLYIVGTVNVDETTHAFSSKVLDRAFTLELTDVDFRQYQPTANLAESVVDAATGDALLRQFSRDGKFARVEKDVIANYARIEEIKTQLQTLNDLLCLHDLHFAYRVFDEIVAFLAAAESNKLYDDLEGADDAFDAAVLMKVLPKFHGSRSRLEKPLCAVLAWCVNPGAPDIKAVEDALRNVGSDKTVQQAIESSLFLYPKTAERVQRMLARLYTDGFAAFG